MEPTGVETGRLLPTGVPPGPQDLLRDKAYWGLREVDQRPGQHVSQSGQSGNPVYPNLYSSLTYRRSVNKDA